MFSTRVIRSAVFIGLVALLPVRAWAQGTTASVAGQVKDSTGGTLPGVVIKAVNEESNAAVDRNSDGDGRYQFDALTPGRYRLEATLSGFETATRRIVVAAGQNEQVELTLSPSRLSEDVVVTARRVEEVAQEVPIPVSVVSGALVANTGSFNVNRLKELIPTVQFYSTNPRNSAVNIRGLGAPFGLTNDGIEQGVGLYIDGVYFARPATATLDFLDVDQIEVLRGPQGTLFGKNTTAGAINVTTRKPGFSPLGDFELNYGDLNFVQVKGAVSGGLGSKKVAGRVSFSETQRDGVVLQVNQDKKLNDLDNFGVRGTLLFAPSPRLAITAVTDYSRQRPDGYTQLVAGVAPTLRPANRQYPEIAADLGYTPPSFNAFDRLTDIDTPLRSYQDLGGSALNINWQIGRGQLTSTTAYRFWHWDPSNDRDFIGLPVTTVSAAPSHQNQWTQEVRYAGDITSNLNFVFGGFFFNQGLTSNPTFKQEQGSAAWRFLLAPTPAAATPGLLDGYGYNQTVDFSNLSAATFGQLSWAVNDRLKVLPGLRWNYDSKKVDFDQSIYGGLQTTDPALIALQLSVLAPQAYKADVGDGNLSGQITGAYKVTDKVNAYATFATSFKSVGLNLNGLPTDAAGNPVLSTAVVKPEDVHHYEAGVKTNPVRGVTANFTVYNTDIKNFQTQVMNASVGVLRGYLANAEKVRVRGAEFDGNARLGTRVTLYGAAAYTDGRYVSFPDAPPPLEDTGGPQTKDISGSVLPGVSDWATSVGGEYVQRATIVGRSGFAFAGFDTSYRSRFSSSATASKYLFVDGYSLANARAGFRWSDGWALTLWARNLFDKDYYDLLTAAPGNTGLIVGQPGDPRTFGVTLRMAIR